MRRLLPLALALGLLTGCELAPSPQAEELPETATGTAEARPADGPRTLSVPLEPVDDSGVGGEALLTEAADGTRVLVFLDEIGDEPRPAHIHAGSCAGLEGEVPIEVELEPVRFDASETVLAVSLGDLTAGPRTVTVHEADTHEPLACGDLVP